MKKILQRDAAVLREIAKEVPIAEIKSTKIQKILQEMKIALASQDDGVAIAAPQIGYSLRIFVVSGKVAGLMRKSTKKDKDGEKNTEKLNPGFVLEDSVFINPVIKKLSKEKRNVEEGCLSVRYLYGKVSRSSKAYVEAYDE